MIRYLPVIALLAASPATAQTFQSTVLIDKAVAGFTGQAIGQDGGARTAVDTRLKLATCSMVTMNWRTPAHDSVVVACPDPEWRIFVPVRIAAPAIVAPTPLAPVAAPAPKPEIVIKRGDPVSVVAGTAGFSVTRDGIAVNDAAVGGARADQGAGRQAADPGDRQRARQGVDPGRIIIFSKDLAQAVVR